MTRSYTRFVAPLFLAPLVLVAGCSRPQPTPEEVAGPISPPLLQYGPNVPGGVTDAPTGGAGGGAGAAGMQYHAGRYGGPYPQPVMSAPDGDQIAQMGGHRMSPTTDNAAEGYSSSGSGSPNDAGTPVPPDVPLQPRFAPGADLTPTASPASAATAAPTPAPVPAGVKVPNPKAAPVPAAPAAVTMP